MIFFAFDFRDGKIPFLDFSHKKIKQLKFRTIYPTSQQHLSEILALYRRADPQIFAQRRLEVRTNTQSYILIYSMHMF